MIGLNRAINPKWCVFLTLVSDARSFCFRCFSPRGTRTGGCEKNPHRTGLGARKASLHDLSLPCVLQKTRKTREKICRS